MKYSIPEMKVTYVESEDIITSSSISDFGGGDGNTGVEEVPVTGVW